MQGPRRPWVMWFAVPDLDVVQVDKHLKLWLAAIVSLASLVHHGKAHMLAVRQLG